ncbi:hypothetical protein Taro_025263, partial [Colocasia esculenta]|nr:hypothetical protein [Colocasia esculenta]
TEMTLHKFDDFVTVVREKRSGRNTTPKRRIAEREHGSANIFGCSAALAVWFLEHTRLRQPIDREAIPRLFRWGSVLDKKLSFSIDSLQGQQIIKYLKLATKEKTTITCVSQEKMHVQTEGVAAPPHLALMALIQGLGDEISQDQPTVGTDAENFFSTPPSLTPAPAALAYGDANASVLIVDQGIIAPVSVVPTTVLLSPASLVKNIKCRDDRQPGIYDQSPFRRLDKALKKHTSYQRKKGKKVIDIVLHAMGHKLHTSLGHENLGCPISDFQFLFFVVHVSNHWVLLSLQLEQRRIVVYNSCRGHATYDTCAKNWEPILKAYLRYKGYRNADEF